jgi:hypothetical protein
MYYGMGRGRGSGRGMGGGMGFAFRGASPPWPYVGIGRGGLPRCGYYLSGAGAPAFYGQATTPGYSLFTPPTGEEELGYLKSQAEAIRGQLEQIETRMRQLEDEKKG